MLVQVGILLLGLVVLYFGAEWLIKGASSIAVGMGIPPLIVGLTVVALGTSLPEFMTNFIAAIQGRDALALGNIVGSNIANVGLILGTSAVFLPLAVAPSTLKREYPIMMGVLVVFYLLALDGTISRIDGGILLVGLAGFLGYLIRDVRRRGVGPDEVVASPELTMPTWKKALLLIGGIVGLAGGASLMVSAAVTIAEFFEIDPVIVGLTIVAIGTSLPELAASLVGVFRNETDLSVGNVIGSNLLNVLFVRRPRRPRPPPPSRRRSDPDPLPGDDRVRAAGDARVVRPPADAAPRRPPARGLFRVHGLPRAPAPEAMSAPRGAL